MKRLFLMVAAGFLVVTGCNKSARQEENVSTEDVTLSQRNCASHEVLEAQLQADPSLRQRLDAIEEFTRRAIADPAAYRLLPSGIIEIPVVVNVLYKTTAQNISLAQIQSQIDVLNKDFSATNTDYNLTSTYQTVKSGDIGVRFVLDVVNRKQTNKNSWQLNDAMKKTSQGGINPSSPTTKLNL
jgi:hypothetical protein